MREAEEEEEGGSAFSNFSGEVQGPAKGKAMGQKGRYYMQRQREKLLLGRRYWTVIPEYNGFYWYTVRRGVGLGIWDSTWNEIPAAAVLFSEN